MTPRALCVASGLSLLLAGATSSPDVQFTDVTGAVGVDFLHESSATPNKYLLETMGGGVALLDVDNDGRLDIFFTNGARLENPMPDGARPDKSDRRYWNRLYRQKADGTFGDVTEAAGLSGMPQNYYGMGVAVGDYDNDGFADLYVTNYEGNTLYRNNGDGTFSDVTARAGAGGSGWSASAGFFDYDNDGHLDLFVTRYVEWTFQKNGWCGEKKPGYRAYCHPDNYNGITNLLFRNNGDGTFTDVSVKSGIADTEGKGLGLHSPITIRTASWTCTSRTIPCSRFCIRTTATARSRRSGCSPASGSTRTARRLPEWAWTSPITTTMATPISL